MPTAVEIANMALLECGAEPITALDSTNEASRACTAAWPFVRKSVLGMHPWNTPTKRALVDEDATDPLWDFATRYPLPSDCIRVLEVDTTADWRIEGRYIATDETGDDLGIRYIYDETDPTNFPPPLVDALVLGLAYRIMHRITSDKGQRDRIERQWMAWVKECEALDGAEQSDAEIEDDTWLTARY
jgi:hypothetical protein